MTSSPEQQKTQHLEHLISRVHDRVDEAQRLQIEAFARSYYQHLAPEDFLEHSVDDLYGAMLAHWNLAHRRTAEERLIHVYNPSLEEYSWRSTHTIIELVVPDMPFLVDSLRMLLNRRGLTVHLIIHPVLHLRRGTDGVLQAILGDDELEAGSEAEAFLHFQVDHQSDAEVLSTLYGDIAEVLDDVQATVDDWQPMLQRLLDEIESLRRSPPPLEPEELGEELAFLEWLSMDHFTFLGCREYRVCVNDDQTHLCVIHESGLGLLRDAQDGTVSQAFARLPDEARAHARRPELLVLTKSDSLATVHRPVYLDYVGVKRFDEHGTVIGELRFLGIYTSSAYNTSPRNIPLLRRKIRAVLDCTGARPNSHSNKVLGNILENLPRGELFQSTVEELCATSTAILQLQERQRVRLLVRRDPYQRFFSCLVFLPREGYNTDVRMRIQNLLGEALNATSVDFSISLSESVLARVYFIAHTRPGDQPDYDHTELEKQILETTRTWEDRLHDALLRDAGEERGNRLFARYRHAFPGSYRDEYPSPMAVPDILAMEQLGAHATLGMSLYRPLEAPAEMLRFKLFRHGDPISLSLVLPMLEHMGVSVVDQRPHKIRPADDLPVWLQDMGLLYREPGKLETEQIRQIFQDAFQQVWDGTVENDGFNRLVLAAHLSWREVVILRSYCKYLLQTGFPFSQRYMERALYHHPQIASLLVSLFLNRFDPDSQEQAEGRSQALTEAILKSLDQVPSLDEDRILRRFLVLVQATLRTNYFQRDVYGQAKPYLSLKLDSTRIPDLPHPCPRYEVFVYSPRTEGIHLRGGAVARGGIRWSDRLEDFRTEVFGLMKAQMVKNSVIVPVGAKGGFVVKRPIAKGDRNTLMDEVTACYRTFIRGLLDITDNLVAGDISPPPNVVRYDDDDPYLVVAADKGTATFSDTANAIAKTYDFWLGDAFASGGSSGYDHKKMGITARGAWESVKRHFRELALDIETHDFTVVGIGSMNGDVFGNGMLLSRHIKLVAAFSHREIFLDPDPDPVRSFEERSRIFGLPGCSWNDFDPGVISEGGGVYARSAKSIPLSPPVRRLLHIDAQSLTPDELIRALLQAPVDLLWNGGIGTFVKASHESHDAAGDRANDGVRVDARQLRCKVVAEGGNLGFTQFARIEFAQHGGRINTDFIDNSAGVDCSDHEVNIKILLDGQLRSGELSERQRERLLEEMTDEVATLVLADNAQQNAALSVAEALAGERLEAHLGLIRHLEKNRGLERRTWQLPGDDEISQRRSNGQNLTRPELAILLAYSKLDLFAALADSDICDDPYLAEELAAYFPAPISKRYSALLSGHRLHREIVNTCLSNTIVNRMGITFAYEVADQTGASAADIARAFTAARKVFELPELWHAIESLDNRITVDHQLRLSRDARKLADRATLWFLRNRRQPVDIGAAVTQLQHGVQELKVILPELLDPNGRERLRESVATHRTEGLSEHLAARFAALPLLFSALDITDIAQRLSCSVSTVAQLYFAVGDRLELHRLREGIAALSGNERWSRLARSALRDELYGLQRDLTQRIIGLGPDHDDPAEQLRHWEQENQTALSRYLQRAQDFSSAPTLDLAMLSVALNEIHKLSSHNE